MKTVKPILILVLVKKYIIFTSWGVSRGREFERTETEWKGKVTW